MLSLAEIIFTIVGAHLMTNTEAPEAPVSKSVDDFMNSGLKGIPVICELQNLLGSTFSCSVH